MKSYRPLLSSIIHLYLHSGFSLHSSSAAMNSDLRFGFRSCPCLQVNNSSLAITFDISEEGLTALGEELASNPSYGMEECDTHDANRKVSQEPTQDDNDKRTIYEHKWCFVDPDNCDLVYSTSEYFFPKRFLSYATCGNVDIIRERGSFKDLNGTVLKVGVNHNSGGWLGAYSEDGAHFEGPWSSWSGATVEFVRSAAETYGFQLNITNDLPFDNFKLGNLYGDGNFFFSQCVHATALGYLDMCIGQYTITTERALAADFIQLTSEPVILLIKKDIEQLTGFAYYVKSAKRAFSPFHWTTWLFTVFFVIPVLGLFSLINHYDTEYFPKTETVTIIDENGEETKVKKRIPLLRHMGLVIYESLISTMQGSSFERSSHAGSMISNIGVSFFVVVITATYTANLASFFTLEASTRMVNSVEEALGAGYRLCASRTKATFFLKVYPHVPASVFVVDPVEEGGDGMPGFPGGRAKALEMLDPVKANDDKRFCHAAISVQDELDIEQSKGNHCDLFAVGPPMFTVNSGIPVSREKRTVLTLLFYTLQNNGDYKRIFNENKPKSRCVVADTGDPQNNEARSLTIMDMIGLWTFMFSFGLVGVVVSLFTPQRKGTKPMVQRISKFSRQQTVGVEENKSSTERVRRNSI